MPLINKKTLISYSSCKKCGEVGKRFRFKKSTNSNNTYYLQSTCKDCEKDFTSKWFKENKKKVKDYNYSRREYSKQWWLENKDRVSTKRRESYVPSNRVLKTKEEIAQRYRDKANLRATRAKKARFFDELTTLVSSEAHSLRKLRNDLTGIIWHVDHVVPLKGKDVCGLHIWNNLAVIPKVENLRKGNHHTTNK